jgi:hypothetical protein
MVYDIEEGLGAIYPDHMLQNKNQPIIRFMTIDESRDELLLFWTPITTPGINSSIQITSYSLPATKDVKAFLADAKRQHTSDAYEHIIPSANTLIFSSLLLVLGISIVVFRKRNRIKSKPSLENITSDDNNILKDRSTGYMIDLSEQPRILLNSKSIQHEFSPIELHLLIWLSWKYHLGNPFQITDLIEELFFSDFPNLDYSRKHRNITIRRINEQLGRVLKDVIKREEWIIDRPVSDDKRKREYAINLEGISVEVNFATDDKTSILPGINALWIENMRKDL